MRLLPLLFLPCLAGCAGYAADYWRPKAGIITPQLSRFGLDERQTACVSERLAASLSVWQLRQLAQAAAAMRYGSFHPVRLTMRDLDYAAGRVEDSRVGPEFTRAIAACGVGLDPVPTLNVTYAQPGAAPEGAPASAAPPAPPVARPAITPPSGNWVNLGAAASGQSISIEASTINRDEQLRTAWFRLTNPGESGPGRTAYLLRIDCAARTINPMALRRQPADGPAEYIDHGPEGEGVLPVEGGTVMEIAYLSLCT